MIGPHVHMGPIKKKKQLRILSFDPDPKTIVKDQKSFQVVQKIDRGKKLRVFL